MQQKYLSDWFAFSRKQRYGIIMLLLIIFSTVIFRYCCSYFIQPVYYDHSAFEKEIAAVSVNAVEKNSWKRNYADSSETNGTYSNRYTAAANNPGELFYFDPNTLDDNGWRKLGVRDKTITTIRKYLAKGGKFYKADDIKRIWGLNTDLSAQLVPYVQIVKQGNLYPETPVYDRKVYAPAPVDINLADTAALIALPGIGSKLAQRIVGFRNKLGGFYQVEQIAETFGLADSVFQKIKSRLVLSNMAVKQININTAGIDEMKNHPYLRYAVANAIIQYRNQHGKFSALSDLKNIVIVTDEIYNKAIHYLVL